MEESFALATKTWTILDEVELALGMEVMVTFNVSTDLDMANGAWGHIVDIVLDVRGRRQLEELMACDCSILLFKCPCQ